MATLEEELQNLNEAFKKDNIKNRRLFFSIFFIVSLSLLILGANFGGLVVSMSINIDNMDKSITKISSDVEGIKEDILGQNMSEITKLINNKQNWEFNKGIYKE